MGPAEVAPDIENITCHGMLKVHLPRFCLALGAMLTENYRDISEKQGTCRIYHDDRGK